MWYVIRVRAGKEEVVMEYLSSFFEVSFPASKRVEVYVGGRRRYSFSLSRDREVHIGSARVIISRGRWRVEGKGVEVREVIGEAPFRGYLFVKGEPKEIERVSANHPHIFGLLSRVKALTDGEMKKIEEKVLRGERVRGVVPQKGDPVLIAGGQFAGLKGTLEEIRENTALIKVSLLDGSSLIEVPLPLITLL